ncbi:hypothetical protein ACFO6W_18575, partial [Dysgonomonas termitidis]
CPKIIASNLTKNRHTQDYPVITKLPYYLAPKSGKNLEELLPCQWRVCRLSHDNLPAIPGMSPDFP